MQQDSIYYYTNESTFSQPLDNVHYFVMRDYTIGIHKQDFFEINIIVHGRGVHYIEGTPVDAMVGDVFILPPELEHAYDGGEGFNVYHILLSNSFMERNFADLRTINGFSILFNVEPLMRSKVNSSLHLRLNQEQFRNIEEILLAQSRQTQYSSFQETCMINIGHAFILITKLCSIYMQNHSPEDIQMQSEDSTFMRSLAMIHERYHEKLTIEELAKVALLSKSTYIRRFMHICKTTPADYIIHKRIEVAENLLKNSTRTLSEVADASGFYDASHFTRIFKKIKGISPSAYREKAKAYPPR